MKPVLCPTCFAKEIDPILLRRDESRNELYCVKCTWFGSEADARKSLEELMRGKYGIESAERPAMG